VEAHPDDRAAIALVATIDELFVIDPQAQEQESVKKSGVGRFEVVWRDG
jgi:hypothetical protein